MQKRARCPLCGMVVWRSQIEKYHNIDILEMNRVVRAKGRGGFKYTNSEDQGLVALVRAKIKALYERFFEPEPSITLVPGVDLPVATNLGSRLRLKTPFLGSGPNLRPKTSIGLVKSILIKPEVKIAG